MKTKVGTYVWFDKLPIHIMLYLHYKVDWERKCYYPKILSILMTISFRSSSTFSASAYSKQFDIISSKVPQTLSTKIRVAGLWDVKSRLVTHLFTVTGLSIPLIRRKFFFLVNSKCKQSNYNFRKVKLTHLRLLIEDT